MSYDYDEYDEDYEPEESFEWNESMGEPRIADFDYLESFEAAEKQWDRHQRKTEIQEAVRELAQPQQPEQPFGDDALSDRRAALRAEVANYESHEELARSRGEVREAS